MTDVTRDATPFDPLTELCARMTEPLAEPGHENIKAIVFLQDGERGGIQLFNYKDEVEGMVDLFIHMKAVFRAAGKDLEFVGVPDSPEDL